MRDVEFPALPSGYLDVEKLAPQLPDLATAWIAGFIEIYEAGARLARPRIAATRISLPSDKSFASFDQALAHARRPLGRQTGRPTGLRGPDHAPTGPRGRCVETLGGGIALPRFGLGITRHARLSRSDQHRRVEILKR